MLMHVQENFVTEQRKDSMRCMQGAVGRYRMNHIATVPALFFLCECVDKVPVFVSLHAQQVDHWLHWIAASDVAAKQPLWAIKCL